MERIDSARLVQAWEIRRCGGRLLRVLLVPFRPGAAHVMELGPVRIEPVPQEPSQSLGDPHAEASTAETAGKGEVAHGPGSNPGTPGSLVVAGGVHHQATRYLLTRSAHKRPANPVRIQAFRKVTDRAPGLGRSIARPHRRSEPSRVKSPRPRSATETG